MQKFLRTEQRKNCFQYGQKGGSVAIFNREQKNVFLSFIGGHVFHLSFDVAFVFRLNSQMNRNECDHGKVGVTHKTIRTLESETIISMAKQKFCCKFKKNIHLLRVVSIRFPFCSSFSTEKCLLCEESSESSFFRFFKCF